MTGNKHQVAKITTINFPDFIHRPKLYFKKGGLYSVTVLK
jgi:hypothetical protein